MNRLEMKSKKPWLAIAAGTLSLAISLLVPAAPAAAAPPLLTQICEGGSGAGQCFFPTGIVADPATGDIYVADRGNDRIDEFTAWGQFIKAWGSGIVNGGATGTGTLTPGSTAVKELSTATKVFVGGMPIEGSGIAPGTTIAVANAAGLTLSQPATAAATGEPTALSSPEAPNNVPVNELQRIAVTATGGTYELSFLGSHPVPGTQTTAPIPYNATPAELQSALEALSNVGAGDVAVTSPNPGGEAGVPGGPYTIEFKGAYADTDVGALEIRAGSPPLSGGTASESLIRNGASAAEVCTGTDCVQGVEGTGPGEFSGLKGLAIDSQGDLYTYESCVDCAARFPLANRVQKFDSEGSFLLMLGGGVDEGPHHPGNLCTAAYIAEGDSCGGGARGSGNGEFGVGPVLGTGDSAGSYIAVGPGDVIYVGGDERIQEFEPDGTFKGLLPDPGGVLAEQDVQSLAVDPSNGDLYVDFYKSNAFQLQESKEGVRKLSPAGALLATLPAKNPQALAVDDAGNVYVADGRKTLDSQPRLREFSAGDSEVPGFAFEEGFELVRALATGSGCGIEGTDLYVANQGGPLESFVRAYGPPPDPALCPPPALAPTIASQYATSVSTDAASLKARINPHFWPDTTYYVEYGTGRCAEGGCNLRQPLAGGSRLTTATVGSALGAPAFLQSLEPGVTYHYRFVAQSSGGGPTYGTDPDGAGPGQADQAEGTEGTFTTFPDPAEAKADCPNQGFRTGAAARLPDCRAYEMVSPIEKNGGDILPNSYDAHETGFGQGQALAAIDGERFTYASLSSFGEPEAAPLYSQSLATRGATGWISHSISPPRGTPALYSPGGADQFKLFGKDLCDAWLLQDSDLALAEGAPEELPNLYRRDQCEEGPYELLTSVAAPGFNFEVEQPETSYLPSPQGFSADGTHTVFRANGKLTGSACTAGPETFQVYETNPEGGPLRLISALPSGKANCTPHGASAGMFSGIADQFRDSNVENAVSADGERVYWSSMGTEGTDLYLRVNASRPQSKVTGGECTEPEKACTLLVSKGAFFWGAEPEGRTAIYSAGGELRAYDAESRTSQPIAGGVLGVAGMSEDASRIYLVSTAALSGSQQNSQGAKALPGQPNLYLYEAGAGFTFIGALADSDTLNGLESTSPYSPIGRDPWRRSSRVSPDGLHLAFTSYAPLTGFENIDLANENADSEIFLYDAEPGEGAGSLHCVSCNPSGARPVGGEIGRFHEKPVFGAARLPGWIDGLHPSNLLSGDGSRLFFESFGPLVPRDTNGRLDVYEWERAGSEAACREAGAEIYVAGAGGCLGLISSGQSPQDSQVLDASADGRDLFFTTGESLLPQDPGQLDVYDAREGGGFPQPPPATPSCEGEACQAPVEAPNDSTPSSASFQGPGNVREGTHHRRKHRKRHHRRKHHHRKAHRHPRSSA